MCSWHQEPIGLSPGYVPMVMDFKEAIRLDMLRSTIETMGPDCVHGKHPYPWWRHQIETFSALLAIHRSPVNSPHKGQWRGDFMFSLICVWLNGWVNNGEADDLRRYRAHYYVTVMQFIYMYMECVLSLPFFFSILPNILHMIGMHQLQHHKVNITWWRHQMETFSA